MNEANKILEKYWGFSEFRPPQEEIISSVLLRNDTVALLPTGGGKSICFQIPTLVNDGICIVISPLIALMNDQVKNLKERNIKAVALTSKLSQNDIITLFDNLKYGNYKFLYLSPEKLQSPLILEKIRQLNVQLIAVDEAHCISEWGHDFRPSYLQIHVLRDLLPKTPIIALTASATKKVLEDIILILNLVAPKIFKKSFYRENLAYQIFDTEDKLFKVEQILKKTKGVKIIYVNTRRKTVELSNQLTSLGYKSICYHGGMSFDEKLNAYENWLSEKSPIIVATNAFGMGIDKANVRVVIHYDLPKSIENYVQEAGRAGRNGKKAFSVVLKNKAAINDMQTLFVKTLATVTHIKKVYFQLNQYYQISYGELLEKTYDLNLSEFCGLYHLPVVITYNAIKTLHKDGVLLFDEKFDRKSTVKFITSNENVFNYCDRNPSQEALIKLLLRSYGGIFDSHKTINENYLCKSLNSSTSNLIKNLKTLHYDAIISFHHANSNAKIQFLVPREDDRTINMFVKNIEQRNRLKKEKMTSLVNFIENDNTCRNIQLLTYFNDNNAHVCGICDVCLSKKKTPTNTFLKTRDIILKLLKLKGELSSKEIVLKLNISEKEIIFCLQMLLEKNRIGVTSQNKFRLIN